MCAGWTAVFGQSTLVYDLVLRFSLTLSALQPQESVHTISLALPSHSALKVIHLLLLASALHVIEPHLIFPVRVRSPVTVAFQKMKPDTTPNVWVNWYRRNVSCHSSLYIINNVTSIYRFGTSKSDSPGDNDHKYFLSFFKIYYCGGRKSHQYKSSGYKAALSHHADQCDLKKSMVLLCEWAQGFAKTPKPVTIFHHHKNLSSSYS